MSSESETELQAPFIETTHGRLYRPLPHGYQILVLIAAFAGGPAFGWIIGAIPGDLSETARTMICVPFVLIFFLGYAAWVARLNAIAFEGLGRSLLKAFFFLILRRQCPKNLEEVLPTKEKLLEMAVKAQKAASSFGPVSWPIALVAGLAALLIETEMGSLALAFLVAASCLAWGYGLAYLGRRGCLPFMEEG